MKRSFSLLAFFLIPTGWAYAIFPFPVASASFETGAYIEWRTDVAGTSQVNYGTTSAYGSSTTLDPTSVTYHEQTITGLTANTTYHFQVVSGGVTSADYTFTTLAAPTGTVKTVKSSSGDYTSVRACATAASAGWTCEVYSGGASDTSVVSVPTGGSSGNPVTFIAHDAVELPGFNIAASQSYVTIEGFELSTAAYSGYQSCTPTYAITLNNGSNDDIFQSNYIHNVYDGGFIYEYSTSVVSNYDRIIGNIMAFAVITNQNPPYTHPCGPSGYIGIHFIGSHTLIDGNDIQEADHLIEVAGGYGVFRRNVSHDTYAADWGANPLSDHVDFFHPPSGTNAYAIHQVIEDNQDYNRNDLNEHFLLDEAYTTQSSQLLGTREGSTKTFSGTVSLGSDTAIAPFSVVVMVCSNSDCSSGYGTGSVYDNGLGGFNGDATGSVNYSSGVVSVTLSTAPSSGVGVYAFYGLLSHSAHDAIVRENLVYNIGSGFVGGGLGGVSGIRIYNNTVVHVGFQGGTSNTGGGLSLYSGGSQHQPSGNWSALNNLFYDAWKYSYGPPWTWVSGEGTRGAFISPPESPPGYSLIFDSSCHRMPGCTYTSTTTSAPGMVISKDPVFRNPSAYDFSLAARSPAFSKGTYLTTVASTDSGSGTSLVVNDAGFFQDGYGISGVDADCIAVGRVSNRICISSIDYSTNTLTLASGISRSAGDKVWLYSDSTGRKVLLGSAPNIGALQQPPPPTNLRTASAQ